MSGENIWLARAVKLQSIAQAGLTYGKDKFDIERYEEIRKISAEIVAHKTEIPLEKVVAVQGKTQQAVLCLENLQNLHSLFNKKRRKVHGKHRNNRK